MFVRPLAGYLAAVIRTGGWGRHLCRVSHASRPTIAIIEDEPSVAKALSLLLDTLGYRPVAGEDADSVLAMLAGREGEPALILADFRLRGGMNGVDAVAAIRAALGRAVPAILVTGDTSEIWMAEAAKQHLPVLRKPVMPAQLVAAIRTALK